MAWVEKRCEFGCSPNDFDRWDMKKWKENLIQVHPSVRYKFKNKHATLIIHEGHWVDAWKPRGEIIMYSTPNLEVQGITHQQWFVKQWFYTLVVTDKDILGEVNGNYYNWTFELGATIRKLKNLVGGTKYLDIVYEKPLKENKDFKYWSVVKEL